MRGMPPRPVGHSGAVQVLPRTACAPPTPREMRVKSIRMTLLGASLLACLSCSAQKEPEQASAAAATRDAAERGAPLGAYDQTLVVLKKLEALVSAAGGHKHNLIKTVVYLTDMADKDEVGRARRDFFGGVYPCATLVAVQALVFPELRVEIDAWARLDVDLRQSQPLSFES